MSVSGLVDPHEVFNLHPADGALLQVLGALYARSVMLTGHVHAVFILVAADNASVGMAFLADQSHLYLAGVGLVGANFEHSFVADFEELAAVSLQRQSFPSTVSGAHVLDVELPLRVSDGRVQVAQVLVVREVQ